MAYTQCHAHINVAPTPMHLAQLMEVFPLSEL